MIMESITTAFGRYPIFGVRTRIRYLAYLHSIRETLDPTDFILWGLEGYRDELLNLKGKVTKKLKQLMLSDYLEYLKRNKANEQKIKLNDRLLGVLNILIKRGRTPLKKFLSMPEVLAFYHKVSASTKTRDFQKMAAYKLVTTTTLDQEVFIEPNFGLLEGLEYRV